MRFPVRSQEFWKNIRIVINCTLFNVLVSFRVHQIFHGNLSSCEPTTNVVVRLMEIQPPGIGRCRPTDTVIRRAGVGAGGRADCRRDHAARWEGAEADGRERVSAVARESRSGSRAGDNDDPVDKDPTHGATACSTSSGPSIWTFSGPTILSSFCRS